MTLKFLVPEHALLLKIYQYIPLHVLRIVKCAYNGICHVRKLNRIWRPWKNIVAINVDVGCAFLKHTRSDGQGIDNDVTARSIR